MEEFTVILCSESIGGCDPDFTGPKAGAGTKELARMTGMAGGRLTSKWRTCADQSSLATTICPRSYI
jgi:hypothetical protein